jgi:hypothetical protein
MISNVSTIVTKNLVNEFFILQKSLELTNPNTQIVVLCDDESANLIKNLHNSNIIILNELKNLNYEDIKKRGKSFLDLVLRKCDVMDYALNLFGETLFTDTDIVFINEFDVTTDKQLILSQHHINPLDEAQYGKYNVGYLLIKDKSFPNWLKETTLTRSKFFEQEGLIHAEKEFDMEAFSMNHNFGWWRLFQCQETQERYKKFGYGANVFYDKKPLVSVHVHMISDGFKDGANDKFADIIMKLLSVSKKKEHTILFNYINKIRNGWNPAKPKIIIPHPQTTDHSGDTFRELVDIWSEEGLCTKEYSTQTDLVWMNSIGDILLYDRPTLEWLGNRKYNFALFGNPTPNLEKTSPWIFWGRRPKLMKMIIQEQGINPLENRDIESIFLGKVENNTQESKRTIYDWSKSTEIFEMPIRGEYKYSQYQYLELLNRSKFGLCLAGYGNKCNREIELFSLGVVPIIADGVDLTYYNKLTEGVHYLKVNTPEEVKPLIQSISNAKWEELSLAGRSWYQENCSPLGSFKTTIKIISER